MKNRVISVGLMSSGGGEGSLRLFKSIVGLSNRQSIKIPFVFCNRDKGEYPKTDIFFSEVEKSGIPLIAISSKKFKLSRNEIDEDGTNFGYEDRILKQLKKFDLDLILAVGYMLITSKIHKKFPMFNLHPALPWGPKGTWKNVIRELIEQKITETGLMIHRVTDELDSGTPITISKFNIDVNSDKSHRDMTTNIRNAILERESDFVCKTLEMISNGNINYNNPENSIDISDYLFNSSSSSS